MRGERRYRARERDTLESLLGASAREEVEQGSVFVDGVRVSDVAITLRAGAEVIVGRARERVPCPVLGEVAGLIAVDKPAALPTEPDRVGHASVRSALALELGENESELHAVGRLDVGVSGVVLFARGPSAKREARLLRERGEIRRCYVGIAEHAPEPATGRWELDVDEKSAVTDYATLARATDVRVGTTTRRPALLALQPVTGRKHQLRVHAEAASAPLLGDRAHGGAMLLVTSTGAVVEPPRLALHARSVSILGNRIVAPVPVDLSKLWLQLGGRDSDWELVHDGAVG